MTLIQILSKQSRIEYTHCEVCQGSGETMAAHPDTGVEALTCPECMGSGYNQLGLILQDILQPPPEGYGPLTLQEAMEREGNGATARLADRKYELARLKAEIEADLAKIDAELKARLQDGEVAQTQHGVGYRLTMTTQETYDQRAIRELSKMKLLPRFARVSTTRLRELVREGRLSERKFNQLHQWATSREIPTLREVPLTSTSPSG